MSVLKNDVKPFTITIEHLHVHRALTKTSLARERVMLHS